MDLKLALETLKAYFKVEEDGTSTLVTTEGPTEKELTLTDVDLAIKFHEDALAKIVASSLVGGMQYYHNRQIHALKKVRPVIVMSKEKAAPSIDPKNQPSLFDDPEYRDMVDVMGSHKLYKTIDPKVAFAYILMCRTCGEVSNGMDEDLHIAHQLLLAGFRRV